MLLSGEDVQFKHEPVVDGETAAAGGLEGVAGGADGGEVDCEEEEVTEEWVEVGA